MKFCKLRHLFLLVFFAVVLSAAPLRFGKWSVVNEEGKQPQLFYGEREIFSRISCIHYLPSYDGVFTELSFANPVVSGNSVVWTQSDKNGEFHLVLTLDDRSARLQLTTRLQNLGPLEYGFRIPLDSLSNSDGMLFLKGDDKPIAIGADEFKQCDLSSFICDLYEEQHQFVNNQCVRRFVLQDQRKWDGKSIRLINSERPQVGETLTWDVSWNVTEFEEEIITKRRQSLADAIGGAEVVRKQLPVDGARVDDNTPCLSWHMIKDARSYTVLISQNPSFPPANTYAFKVVDTPSLQLERPLAPGIWFWKVLSQNVIDKQPWSFKQTAPLERDCTPPRVTLMGHRILDKNATVRIPVYEASSEAPRLEVHVGDKSVPVRLESHDDNGFWVFGAIPEDGWPEGFSALTISATDASDNNATSQMWLLNCPKPANGVVINAKGRYEENGKQIFPYGFYQVENQEDMAELRSLGFNAIHTYRWENSRDDEACRAYLDKCWATDGLRAFIGFDRKAIVNGEFDVVARRVGALADHPGLFVYYLFDEPEDPAHYVSFERMNKFADLIRALDPYHAVVLTTWNQSMINYRRTWDTHWSQAYGTPGYVVGLIDDHKRFLKNSSPITLLLHCYDQSQMANYRATGTYDAKAFQPDCDWMRCAAWAGICQDVNGLWWWWFVKNDKNWLTAPTIPEVWKGFCSMMRELRSYQEFLESDKMTYGRIEINHQIVVWGVKRTADKELLIVANTGLEPVRVQLPAATGHTQPIALGRYGVFLSTRAFP